MKTLFLMLALTSSAHAGVDLRDYLPNGRTVMTSGSVSAMYTIKDSKPSQWFGMDKPGQLKTLKKEYNAGNGWQLATTAYLYYGDDKSITELGDIIKGQPLTYGGKGLEWARKGGLTNRAKIKTMPVIRGGGEAKSKAYFTSHMIEHLPSHTLMGGNRATYYDVVHVIMYHGTQQGKEPNNIYCSNFVFQRPGVMYFRHKNYKSYAMEYYIAKGVGIIEEVTPYIEDGSFWGAGNCIGELAGQEFHSYRAN